MRESLVCLIVAALFSGCSMNVAIPSPTRGKEPPRCQEVGSDADAVADFVPIFVFFASARRGPDGFVLTLTETNIGNVATSIHCTVEGENEEVDFFVYDIYAKKWMRRKKQLHVPNFALNPGKEHCWQPRVFGGGDERPVFLRSGDSYSHDYLVSDEFGLEMSGSYAFFVTDANGDRIQVSCLIR